ncbi:MAG: hypothetical protein DI586_07700 [Micavibrio aeruginosavorus]|uniref:Uncharacterized protein n=1 Tax=Micavibrio aeruginosavorus TaxID=349221 RepID=A0A2W5HMX1_9BACT|nr:MAG: hypothetical protein DI586_07700 [Micavibrio aeruginosavorus]
MTKIEEFRKEVIKASRRIARDVERQHPDFQINFIIFQRGQRNDECERSLSALKGHPCETSARELLKTLGATPESSSFVGIAGGIEKSMMGLRRRNHLIGFIALNIDSYTDNEACLFDLYHHTAQAMDTYYLAKKNNLQLDKNNVILEPKRSQLSLSRNHLKSDIFSALALSSSGDTNAAMHLADQRARKCLTPQTMYRPEDYPFVISSDVMKYTIENQIDNDQLLRLFDISGKVAFSFDKYNIKSWINFATPAQTMAWSGCTPEQILGMAVNTGTDALIKATANLVAEITNIKPETPPPLLNVANPFVDIHVNSQNHLKLSEESFEMAIMDAVKAGSPNSLIDAAHVQNHDLMKGRLLGWCADALQAAGRAFDIALKKGTPPEPASRIEFQRLSRGQDEWKNLDILGSYMIAERRSGNAVTFNEIEKFCSRKPDLKHVMESLRLTMEDPAYIAQLQYANEPPRPRGPTPQAAPQAVPQYTPAPAMAAAPSSGMGMAGGMMSGAGTVQRQAPQKKTEEQQ